MSFHSSFSFLSLIYSFLSFSSFSLLSFLYSAFCNLHCPTHHSHVPVIASIPDEGSCRGAEMLNYTKSFSARDTIRKDYWWGMKLCVPVWDCVYRYGTVCTSVQVLDCALYIYMCSIGMRLCVHVYRYGTVCSIHVKACRKCCLWNLYIQRKIACCNLIGHFKLVA